MSQLYRSKEIVKAIQLTHMPEEILKKYRLSPDCFTMWHQDAVFAATIFCTTFYSEYEPIGDNVDTSEVFEARSMTVVEAREFEATPEGRAAYAKFTGQPPVFFEDELDGLVDKDIMRKIWDDGKARFGSTWGLMNLHGFAGRVFDRHFRKDYVEITKEEAIRLTARALAAPALSAREAPKESFDKLFAEIMAGPPMRTYHYGKD